jgi:hypothetical protein
MDRNIHDECDSLDAKRISKYLDNDAAMSSATGKAWLAGMPVMDRVQQVSSVLQTSRDSSKRSNKPGTNGEAQGSFTCFAEDTSGGGKGTVRPVLVRGGRGLGRGSR